MRAWPVPEVEPPRPAAGSDAAYLLAGEAPPMDPSNPKPRREREIDAWNELVALGYPVPPDLTDQMRIVPPPPPAPPVGP